MSTLFCDVLLLEVIINFQVSLQRGKDRLQTLLGKLHVKAAKDPNPR